MQPSGDPVRTSDPADAEESGPGPVAVVARADSEAPVMLESRQPWLTWLGADHGNDGPSPWNVPVGADNDDPPDDWGEGPTTVRPKLDPPTIPNNPQPEMGADLASLLPVRSARQSELAFRLPSARPPRIPIRESWEDEDTKEWVTTPPFQPPGSDLTPAAGLPWGMLTSSHINPALAQPPQELTPAVSFPWAAFGSSSASSPLRQPLTSAQPEHPGWYARLKLRDHHLAKLWAFNLTPRDVVVWSAEEKAWVPLLAVRQLRAAVLSVLKDTDGGQSPLGLGVQPSARGPLGSLSSALETVEEGNYTPSSTTMPPTVVSVPAPDIPRAPRVPTVGLASAVARVHPALGLRVADFLARASDVLARVPRVAGNMRNRAPLGYAERAFWMAAGIALVVGVGAGLKAGVPRARQLSSAGVTAARLGQASAQSHTGTAARSPAPVTATPAAQDRVFSINELATEEMPPPAAAPAPGPKPRAGVAPSRRRRTAAVAKASGKSQQIGTSSRAVRGEQASAGTPPSGVEAKTAAQQDVSSAFDLEVARSALTGAAQRARLCAEGGGARGRVAVVFGPSGSVQSVALTSVTGTGIRKDCLLRVFSQPRVPPFSGPPVTLRKSFDLEYSSQ